MNDQNPDPSKKAKIIGFVIVLVVLVVLWAMFSGGSDQDSGEDIPAGLSS